MDGKEIGNISVYENEDGKAVWEFKGLVTSDTPLDTEKQDYAGAINELAKKLQQGGGGDEPVEDWQPPADWLTVPDPAENEIYVLIEVIDDTLTNFVNFPYGFMKPENGWGGQGALSIDWGDGNAYSWQENGWGDLSHTYSSVGQYLIKITTEIGENNAFMAFQNYKRDPQDSRSNVLICKTGSGIVFKYSGYTASARLLFGKKIAYFKHCGKAVDLPRYFASQWSGLVKVEFGEPIKIIPECGFNYCGALRILDTSEIVKIGDMGLAFTSGYINSFPKCIEIGNNALWSTYCSKINLPNCEKVGNYALQNNKFRELNLPKCTSFGDYAAANCGLLSSVNMPVCENIGTQAFIGDYSLSEITVPAECNFGTDCFKGCYSLYPRPDGTIN